MIVWLVVKYRSDDDDEYQGIFSDKNRAIAACRGKNFAYTDFVLDHELPIETVDAQWTYPNQELEWID